MKTPKKSESTRKNILENGYALVKKRGFGALGLQEILSASGVPKGSFYYYFTSKEAFGVALLQHYVHEYQQTLSHLPSDVTGRDWLMNYFRGWFPADVTLHEPGHAEDCLVVKLAAEVSDLSEQMRHVLRDGVGALVAQLAEVVCTGRKDGSIPDGQDAADLAETLYQLWLGAALLARLTRSNEPFDRALAATEILLGAPYQRNRPVTGD